MSKADELAKKAFAKNNNPQYWVDLNKEIQNFFNGDDTEEEKRKLRKNWACLEHMTMKYNGYKRVFEEKN